MKKELPIRVCQCPSWLYLYVCLGGLVWAMSGCAIGRKLPPNEKLYAGTRIAIKADSTISAEEQAIMKEKLAELARPRPNSTIFGFPYRVGLYYLFGSPDKEKGFGAWFRKKFGREPVLASARALQANIPVWRAFLTNEGYFGSDVSAKFDESGYKAYGNYTVTMAPRFYIDSVAITIRQDSSMVRRAMRGTASQTVIKKGDPYRLDAIKIERERISQSLKQRGFFYFQPDYIKVLALNDTARHRTNLYFAVDPETPSAALLPYHIRNVYVYPNYNLSTAQQDTNRRRAYQTNEQFRVVDSSRRFNPKLFRDIIAIKPGQRYSARAQDLTLSRFINVGAFKFVRNRFEPDTLGDSTLLDVHYYLTPHPAKSLRLELDGTSRSNNFNGGQLTLSWRNRNTMRRAELLTLNANIGAEVQLGGNQPNVVNYRLGSDAVLSFPRLVAPFRLRYDQRAALPKTNVTLGYQTIQRGGLYRINSFQTTFGYSWRQSVKLEHTFTPFNITYLYVPLSSISGKVQEILMDTAVSAIVKQQYITTLYFSNQLIPSSLYTLNFNTSPRSASQYTYRLTANAELAGNLAQLTNGERDDQGRKMIVGVPFAQFARIDADNRLYYKVSKNITWANRFFVGLGIPYGNSKTFQLPFIRQYFVGGSNSIRGFRPRTIGPGVFARDTIRNIPVFQDGGGDIKLEANTELRFKVSKYFELATFIDAGNVWTYWINPAYNSDTTAVSQFTNKFYRQIAVGTGVGLRIDLSYFLIRADLGVPLRKPYKTDGNEWIIHAFDPLSRDWRKNNLVLNIAVGYPF